jgi:hypothetical protein
MITIVVFMTYVKTMHDKRKFERMCRALEGSKNLACHYEAEKHKVDFIYKNKTSGEERTLRYEKK